MWSNRKVVPTNENYNTVTTTTITNTTTTTKNTLLEGDTTLTTIPPNNNTNINVIVKQSTLALEVEILVNNREEGKTIYKLRGSTLDWLMLVDCDFGSLGKFDILSGERKCCRIVGVLLFL